MLRLTQPADRRLPTAVELGDWMCRAASVLMPVTGLHSPVTGTQIATHGGAAS